MIALDRLEETIQDFIDECADHDCCEECPCIEFCLRFETGPYGFLNPSRWKIEKVSGNIPN